tara:strand:+ start:78 stop:1136 length:1059 start_codon:yes stop_codon:yes gene_type:complete
MKKLIFIFLFFISATSTAQLNLLRFATFYASYTTNTPQIGAPSFMVQGTEPDNPYDFVPNFVDGELVELTPQYAPNVILTLGIRKIARFDYQIKQNNFYTGNEHQATDYATISNAPGLEYLFQYSFVRNNGLEVAQQEYNVRYISNMYTAKANYVNNELIDLKYSLGEVRLRKSFGGLDFTFGVAHRSHPVYGYNPIEDVDMEWEDFAISQNYFRFNDGVWLQFDEDNGEVEWLAASDNEFYKYHFGELVTNYNESVLKNIGLQQEVSAVLGLDYYLYRDTYWLHAWGSLYPLHKGLTNFSYQRSAQAEWDTGLIFGVNLNRHLSLFVEGKHLKFWGMPSYELKTGINYLIF